MVELMVAAGVGEPDVASWALVNSNKSLVNSWATHKSPDESKTMSNASATASRQTTWA